MENIWLVTIPITLIIVTIIKELFKERRIKLFKEIDIPKIEASGNYELKSSLKERTKNNYIVQILKSIISKQDES
ncbi:hypothetical protein [Maribacter ulvicola]|uniref:Uncharacterized protein n=1 Tax=Maribacter ulvicola TaxID=228959 RepID=A0A1N6P7R3_9FLAO|nr:hypothetical protein [Maribacter ulvicola]SIQ00323.1 hypothetical protein SAMN05421797_101315 [Maribacter ulvicola]